MQILLYVNSERIYVSLPICCKPSFVRKENER
jgi:hypothetical protein